MEDALKQKQEVSLAIGPTIVDGLAAARRLVVARKAEVVCGALLLVMAANLLVSISRKSITNDEIVHIPAGYYHLVAGDFQLNNEHPPLVKLWAALPLLLLQPEEPSAPKTEEENFMQRTWGFHERFWQANQPRFETVTFWPRVMMVPITLALGLLIFVFARRLFGDAAALIAVALYVLEPTVLAHGRIVHTDVPSALVYLLFFFALYRYHEAPGLRRAIALGSVCAVALLTKFSMLILVPVLAVYFLGRFILTRRAHQNGKSVLLHGGVGAVIILFLVNLAYRFQHPGLEASDVRWVLSKSPSLFGFVTTSIKMLSKIIPTYYLFGVYNIEMHNHYGHATSLLGRYSDLGWWYYFPVAFALKTTLPFLIVSVAALAWSVWRLVRRRDGRFVFIVVPVAVYLAISLTSHINIGVRHFLPVYPFLFIAGGALLARLLRARKVVGIVVLVVSLGWITFEAARTFPNYMPYMNQLASGHPHWYYLADSNVEWGDDVNALAAYLKARSETKVSASLAAGWSTLRRYDVEYVDLTKLAPDATPETRYVAIGASELNGATIFISEINGVPVTQEQRVNLFERYRGRQPEAVFGDSIYLFREKQ
jgi:Dolichyl-phosphate-mannose-protein mannosyltransferase